MLFFPSYTLSTTAPPFMLPDGVLVSIFTSAVVVKRKGRKTIAGQSSKVEVRSIVVVYYSVTHDIVM